MKNILIMLVLLPISNLFGQSFKYRSIQINENYYNNALKTKDWILNNYFEKAVDLTVYLPKNFSVKGDVDYTRFIQKGLSENKVVLFPNFPILISPEGLKLYSNSRVLFREKSLLIIKANDQGAYQGLLIDGVSDVNVYFAKIKGDRNNHLDNKGQWGMGIWINNSSLIKLYAPYVSNCWGDGIYVGNKNKQSSSKISIESAWLDNNRRNGISVISGNNIKITKSIISNSNGQNPQSGIDVEPNNDGDLINNIILDSIVTFNNAMHGIVLSTGNLGGSKRNKISIAINNHKDYYSTIGLGLSITRDNLNYKNLLSGSITVKNSNYISPKYSFIKNYKGKSHSVILNFDSIKLDNISTSATRGNLSGFLNNYNKSIETNIK